MSNNLELKVSFSAEVQRFINPVKHITSTASNAAKALRDNADSMKELNRTVERIDAFKKLEKQAAITANVFEKNQRALVDLKEKIAQVGVPTKAMAAELQTLSRRSDELKAKHESLATAEQKLWEKLKASGIDTRNLAEHRRTLASASAEAMNSSRRLTSALEAENKKLKDVRAAQAELQKVREAAGKWRDRGAGMIAAGAAVNAAAAIPVLAYAKAEDATTQLRIAMMQKGGDVSAEYKQVDALASRLGNKLPGTTADFQDMMTMLIRQGMSAKSILGGLGEATAYLAVQLKMGPAAAAEFASKLQDATRATDKEMMGLMDTIQRTFYLGVDQNNMLQGFAKLSPALSIIKMEGKAAADALAPLLVMADQSGMDGSASGNAFRKIFQMAMDAKKVGKGNAELAGTGVKLDFTDGKGEFGGLPKLMAQLETLRGVSTQKRLAALKKIFGDDAETLQALSLMIDKGVEGYGEVQSRLEKQADLQRRVNEQLGTLKSLWDAASGTFQNILVALGESIAPELHATAEAILSITEKTQEWAKENPTLSGALMTTVKIIGLGIAGIGGLAIAAGGVVVPLAIMKVSLVSLGVSGAASMSLLGLAIKGVGLALKGTMIGLALTALVTAGALVYQNWDKVRELFASMFDGILVKINRLKENLRYLMPGIFGDLKDSPTRGGTTATIAASPILRQASAAAGNVYQISVSTQPGANNQDLARQIREEMERMDRAKAARRRSSLRDKE